MSDRESSNSFVWFVAGMGLGALVGVLYAPRPGTETRDVLRARAEEGRDYMRSAPARLATRLQSGSIGAAKP